VPVVRREAWTLVDVFRNGANLNDAAGYNAIGSPGVEAQVLLEKPRSHERVVVEEDDDLAACALEADVACGRGAAVRCSEDAGVRQAKAGDGGTGWVSFASIVDDDDLELLGGHGLPREVGQRTDEHAPPLERRDEDARPNPTCHLSAPWPQ
jgi:hypothetical protein